MKILLAVSVWGFFSRGLKILGLILLALLVLFLFLLILVLALPIRYEAVGRASPPEYEARGKISFFLGVLTCMARVNQEKFGLSVRLFGVPVLKRGTRWKPETADTASPPEKKPEPAAGPEKKPEPKPAAGPEKKPEPEPAAEKEKKTKDSAADRARQAVNRVQTLWAQLHDPVNLRMFHLVRHQLARILRHILPRELSVNGSFGTGDPATTGCLLGLFYMLCPLWYRLGEFELSGDFDGKSLRGRVYLKGHIQPGMPLLAVLRLALDRDIRHFVREHI